LMLRMDPDSALHCDGCKDFLGIMHCARYALFKRKGGVYYVPCKKCGGLNKRIKGELGAKLDGRWTEGNG
jgi:RNase P subunit RPR2